MIKQKVNGRLYTLKKVWWTINGKDALILYQSSNLPHIDQGLLFYGGANQDQLRFKMHAYEQFTQKRTGLGPMRPTKRPIYWRLIEGELSSS